MADSTRHRLLISVPDMGDPNFDQTVVFVIDHEEGGALGVVINRPSESPVSDHIADLDVELASPPVLFIGGPVSIGGILAIGRRKLDRQPSHVVALSGPLALIEPDALVEGTVEGVEAVRIFTGYSGWAAGQLDGELAAGAWHVVDAMPDDVLCAEPEQLWRRVMRRQGGRLAAHGLYPEDPSVN